MREVFATPEDVGRTCFSEGLGFPLVIALFRPNISDSRLYLNVASVAHSLFQDSMHRRCGDKVKCEHLGISASKVYTVGSC